MGLTIRPLHPTLAAEVSGVDLRQADRELAEELVACNDRYPVLVFRGQELDDETQVRFASMFGLLDPPGSYQNFGAQRRIHDGLADVSNVDVDGRVRPRGHDRRLSAITNELWHTDDSWKAVPGKYSMLYGVAVPSTGHLTEFADLRAAYDALDDRMKERLDGLVAEHSRDFSTVLSSYSLADPPKVEHPPVPQRIVRSLPSGRMTLYLASHAGAIIGWPVSEGRSLLFDLIDHATQSQFVYCHDWRPRDLVWWDDRCTMHRARPNWDEGTEVRDMRRAIVSDIASTLEQPRALAR